MASGTAVNRSWRSLTFLVLSIVVIYAAGILYASFSRHQMTQDGRSPLSEMRVLITALVTYEGEYGSFPSSISALGGSESGNGPSPAAAELIGPALASGHKLGYTFLYKPSASKGNGKNDLFTITADPDNRENPSHPRYFVDQTGVIRVELNRQATANSVPLKY